MFVTFFGELKAAGVPVTLREYLTLMEAMQADLAGRRVEDFYYLSRAALVKDERNLDKFDRVFATMFRGLESLLQAMEKAEIPEEWLRKLAEKYYGPIPRRPVEARRRPSEGGAGLPQKVMRADARVVEPRWSRDFIAPSYRSAESRHAYALTVLSHIFGGSETSRLWRAMVVDSKLALSASAGYSATRLGLSAFDISVHPAPQKSIVDMEGAVVDQMKKLLDDGVTPEEVERTQNQLLAAAIYSQDSLQSGPRLYGSLLGIGGTVADIDAWPERIGAVTPDAVVAAARAVWKPERLVTSLLMPQEGMR